MKAQNCWKNNINWKVPTVIYCEVSLFPFICQFILLFWGFDLTQLHLLPFPFPISHWAIVKLYIFTSCWLPTKTTIEKFHFFNLVSFLQMCLPPWFLTSVWVSVENRQRNGVEVKAQWAGGRATRTSQLIHGERLCHLIDGPPDLTFTKVCRGQRQRSWRGERLSNLLSFIRLIQ